MQDTDPKGMFYIAGEPAIVADTRRHILRAFEDLEFYEEGHRYLLHGQQLNSVSGVGERFDSQPFDAQRQAPISAAKYGGTPESWIQKWAIDGFRAAALGTKTHAFGESLAYVRAGHPELINPLVTHQYMAEYNYLAPTHPREEAVAKFLNEMDAGMHLVLNEAQVYSGKNPDPSKNLKEQIAGTFDMLYYYDGGGDAAKAGFVVLDYKTNQELASDFSRHFDIMLKPPFAEMYQESISHYTIQLSLYALILEDIGIPVIARRIIWLKDDGYQSIPIPDVSSRLRQVL